VAPVFGVQAGAGFDEDAEGHQSFHRLPGGVAPGVVMFGFHGGYGAGRGLPAPFCAIMATLSSWPAIQRATNNRLSRSSFAPAVESMSPPARAFTRSALPRSRMSGSATSPAGRRRTRLPVVGNAGYWSRSSETYVAQLANATSEPRMRMSSTAAAFHKGYSPLLERKTRTRSPFALRITINLISRCSRSPTNPTTPS
jgi:hypothetical protein